MIAPILVFGWGNLSRGDDALGPMFVNALREQLPPAFATQVDFLDDYQLQVEHALDLVGRTRVLFVDASLDATAPFEVHPVHPSRDTSYTTHSLTPEALLQVYQELHSQSPPPCLVLAIRGNCFELGEPTSAPALANLECAVAWALTTLQAADSHPG